MFVFFLIEIVVVILIENFIDVKVVVDCFCSFYVEVIEFLIKKFMIILVNGFEGCWICVFYLEIWIIMISFVGIDSCLFFGYVVESGVYVIIVICFDLFWYYLE